MSYGFQPFRSLTRDESRALLRACAEEPSYRDHMLFSLALGTGLRAHEAVALDVGQAFNIRRKGRQHIELVVFKGCERIGGTQSVSVPDALRHKLSQFARWKRSHGQPLELGAPLFVSRSGGRLTDRSLRMAFVKWRAIADVRRSLTYHSLRHTFCQRLYEQTRDIRVVQVAARHVDVSTTTKYATPSEEMVQTATRGMEC